MYIALNRASGEGCWKRERERKDHGRRGRGGEEGETWASGDSTTRLNSSMRACPAAGSTSVPTRIHQRCVSWTSLRTEHEKEIIYHLGWLWSLGFRWNCSGC